MNFLEQLVGEWYEYRGYFVRSNIKCGKRAKGGWEGEIDVAAFHPKTHEFVHIETSTDADSWAKRQLKFRRKFETAAPYYASLFPFDRSSTRKLAILGLASPKKDVDLGRGIESQSIQELLREIVAVLKSRSPLRKAVPESFPLLRAIQYAVYYTKSRGATAEPQSRLADS